jgi:glycosyltransferase involved in cell wall biosynthesis
MSIADVSLSVVEPLEPLSWSVLQAAACGSAVVVGDQATYRDESARGLAVRLVSPRDVTEVTAAMQELLDDPQRRASLAGANDRFLTGHHDQHAQMVRLLRIVAGRAAADRLMRCGSPEPDLVA